MSRLRTNTSAAHRLKPMIGPATSDTRGIQSRDRPPLVFRCRDTNKTTGVPAINRTAAATRLACISTQAMTVRLDISELLLGLSFRQTIRRTINASECGAENNSQLRSSQCCQFSSSFAVIFVTGRLRSCFVPEHVNGERVVVVLYVGDVEASRALRAGWRHTEVCS